MVKDIKKTAFTATAFVIGGYGLSQAMRLGGNLVLTRLLVPELFGIMAIAQVFINGLYFFADIGLGANIIRSPRGNDPVFLNTAWTLQVIRGAILSAITLALGIPVAILYKNPILAWIIPIVGLSSVVLGFKSTAVYTLNKDIRLGKLAAMELSVKFIGLICMITLAYMYKSIWSLVIGSLVVAFSTTIWTHFLDPRVRNRFTFEKAAASELIGFGKWIFFSTAMMFLATQADRLLLGKLFPLALFGVYNIAVIFAELPKQVISQVSNKVIFPLISHFSHLPRKDLRTKILHKRKLLLVPLALLIALLASFGDILVDFLYDDRYQQAGWMLSLLAIGMWPLVLYATIDRCLYVIGKPKYSAFGNCLKFIYMLIIVPLFFLQSGPFGAVLAVALNDLPVYAIVNYGLKREGLSGLKQDTWATLILLGLMCVFLLFRYHFEMGSPFKAIL